MKGPASFAAHSVFINLMAYLSGVYYLSSNLRLDMLSIQRNTGYTRTCTSHTLDSSQKIFDI